MPVHPIMKRVLLDCDPGIDDSVAIIFALKSKALHVEAITCASGNLPADRTSQNALKILDLIGAPEIPVARGAMAPLNRPLPRDPFSHGEDGLGNTQLPESRRQLDARFAPDVIVDTIRKYPGEVTLIATAPMTNLALAFRKSPEIARLARRLIAIVGAFGFNDYARRYATGGNPVSEWNAYVDPEAVRIVFHSGIPVSAIGVDVFASPKLGLGEEHLRALRAATNRESRYVLDLVNFVSGRRYRDYCVLIDSLAVGAAIDETILRMKTVEVDVETKGELTLGQTVVDAREHHRWDSLPRINAAYDVDYFRHLHLLISTIAE